MSAIAVLIGSIGLALGISIAVLQEPEVIVEERVEVVEVVIEKPLPSRFDQICQETLEIVDRMAAIRLEVIGHMINYINFGAVDADQVDALYFEDVELSERYNYSAVQYCLGNIVAIP